MINSPRVFVPFPYDVSSTSFAYDILLGGVEVGVDLELVLTVSDLLLDVEERSVEHASNVLPRLDMHAISHFCSGV